MRIRALLALLVLLAPVVRAEHPTTSWDSAVEYKLALAREGVADPRQTIAALAPIWKRVTGDDLTLAARPCRTIRFYDTPDRTLRATGIALRVRVDGPDDGPCVDAAGAPTPGSGAWDASAKWTTSAPHERPSGAPFAHETDWLAGSTGDVRVRFAAAVEHESKKKAQVPPPATAAAAVATLALPAGTASAFDGATPVCAAPILDLRWRDKNAWGEPTLTIWKHDAVVIAAELSWNGTPADAQRATTLRVALRDAQLLGPEAAGKVAAVYAACPK